MWFVWGKQQNWEILGSRNCLIQELDYIWKIGLRIREKSQIMPQFLDWENGWKEEPFTKLGNTRQDTDFKRKVSQVWGMLNVKCLWNIKWLCPIGWYIHLEFSRDALSGYQIQESSAKEGVKWSEWCVIYHASYQDQYLKKHHQKKQVLRICKKTATAVSSYLATWDSLAFETND